MLFGDTSPIILGKMGVKSALASHNPIPNLNSKAWYDGADTATITHSAGAVSQWNDKSGNGNHVTQSVGSKQPFTGVSTINGLNAITPNVGLSSYLSKADFTTSSTTIFAVLRNERTYPETGTTLDTVIRHTGTGSPIFSSFNGYVGSNDYPAIRQEDLAGDLYINGVTKSNDDTFAADTDVIFTLRSSQGLPAGDLEVLGRNGNTWTHKGRVGEIVIFDREVIDGQCNQIGRYLGQKWGITWTDI